MREVKKLNKEQLKAALTIAARCYPMMEANTLQKLDEIEARILKDFDSSKREWYGLFEDGVLLGNMVLYDYTVNFYGKDIKARGIGFVAVEFLHKKQKVARDMLSWYLKDSQKKKYSLVLLYSFRPDFYKKMGFGYETSCYNYRTQPDRLPASKSDNPLGYIGIENLEEVTAFYAELYRANHGMIRKNPKDLENMLKAEGVNRVGCRENGKLTALMMFRLIANDSTNQTTHMKLDLLFSTPTALKTALGFLNNQADQVSEIDISTPYRDLFYSLADIRNLDHRILQEPGFHHVYDAGMGLMCRSLNAVELLKNKPNELNIKIRFKLAEDFLDGTQNDFIIVWKEGKAALSKGNSYDVMLSFDVAEFSSWVMNAIDLFTLYQYGLVEISDISMLKTLDRAFYYHQKPLCLEKF